MPERDDFAWVLASSIHEMKNSLALVRQEMEAFLPRLMEQDPERARLVEYEMARLGHGMVQLLRLYKLGRGASLHLEEVFLPEFFQGLRAEHGLLMERRGISLEVDCPDDLLWFLDETLVAGALNSLVNNAMRYSRDRIRLSAREQAGFLLLEVADNGPGYPPHLLELGNAPAEATWESGMGSTGLGLFFAGKVAALHENRGRRGYTRLHNGQPLGGGVFQLFLP